MSALTPAQRQLVEENLDLVRIVLLKHWPDTRFWDDRYQDGVLGLIDAAIRYRPEEGCSFRTFAASRVRGAIIDGARREGGRRGSARWAGSARTKSLDAPLYDNDPDGATCGDLCAEPGFEDALVDRLYAEAFAREIQFLLEDLSPRDCLVLSTTLGEQTALGLMIGLTEGRISQIHREARERIAHSVVDQFGVRDEVA